VVHTKLLILESNEDYRSFLWTVLRGAGFQLEAPSSSEAALNVLQSTEDLPQLIIGNLFAQARQPGPVIEALALAPWRSIPVVLYATDADTRRFNEVLQVAASVVKGGPMPITEILDKIRAVLPKT
jgi:CheY-like chemotaxis protein